MFVLYIQKFYVCDKCGLCLFCCIYNLKLPDSLKFHSNIYKLSFSVIRQSLKHYIFPHCHNMKFLAFPEMMRLLWWQNLKFLNSSYHKMKQISVFLFFSKNNSFLIANKNIMCKHVHVLKELSHKIYNQHAYIIYYYNTIIVHG